VSAWISYQPEIEPDGWYRCPTDGRRRPDGDKTREYIEP
jgi:hypothetical protein